MVKIFALLGGPLTDTKEYFRNIISALTALIPKVVYLLCTFIMQIIDLAQLLFKKLAGVDVYYVYQNQSSVQSAEPVTGDFIEYFIKEILIGDGALHTAFIGILIIGACLLFLSTLLAVFRTQYMAEDAKSASPKKVIGNAIKAIVSFIVVPAACILGATISGQIIQAIESATNVSVGEIDETKKQNILEQYTVAGGGQSYIGYDLFGVSSAGAKTTPISGIVFRAAAYRANRIRNSVDFRSACQGTGGDKVEFGQAYSVNMNGLFDWAGDKYEEGAAAVDDAFANCYKLKTATCANFDANYNPYIAASFSSATILGDFTASDIVIPIKTFSKYRVGVVWYYYDLWQFDFVIALGSILTILIVFFNLLLGLIKRIFEIAMLTLVSPGLIGIMPLDGGAGLKKWREAYIKKVIGAYSAVFCINIFYLLQPILNNIGFFGIQIIDSIINAIIVIAGLVAVRDLIKMISDVIGAENYEEEGKKMSKDFVDKTMAIGGTASAFARPAVGLTKKAFKATPVGKKMIEYADKVKDKVQEFAAKHQKRKQERYVKKHNDHTNETIEEYKERRAKMVEKVMKKEGLTKAAAEAKVAAAENDGAIGKGQANKDKVGTYDYNMSKYEGEIYADKYTQKAAEKRRKFAKGVSTVNQFSTSTFTAMSEDQEWGFAKMKERNEKGGGLAAIFGKKSNFAGKSAKDRKTATSQEELIKQQKTQAAVHETKIQQVAEKYKTAYTAATTDVDKQKVYTNAAQELAKSEGRSANNDDFRAVSYRLSNGAEMWPPP